MPHRRLRARPVVAVALAALVALSFPLARPAAALDADKTQPVTLEADDFELDLASGARIYRGQVEYRQGSIRIDCDELVTRHDDAGELQTGVCTGRPGRFQQTLAGDGDDAAAVVRGQALTITYERAAGRVVLAGEAQVAHRGDRLRGARIVYDLAAKRARVTGDDAGARPRIEVQPRPAAR